jgi:glycogen debranching enzyme
MESDRSKLGALRKQAIGVLRENQRMSGTYHYTLPSAEHYPYQWLWDSCFHAIIYSHLEPELARAEIFSLLSKQFEDGMVPHIIYWTPGILHLFKWGVEGTSSLTQPPMLAYAVWEVHRRAPDEKFLSEVYPRLMRYYEFLIEKRDPRHHHLIGIINPDESGEDDSPRFDAPLKVPPGVTYESHLELRKQLVEDNRICKFDAAACMREYFWVKDVLFNTVMVENLRSLGHIASLLGHSDGEHFAHTNANKIAEAMREHMFEQGVYWSLSGWDLTKLKVSTWTHFAPLFAGLYSQEEASSLVATQFGNPDTFYAPYGIRTVSKQEPSYLPGGYGHGFSWRGPVWMAPHWFMFHGLLRYGFVREAADIRDKSIELLLRHGFREHFDPDTSEPGGAHQFTWGALILDMLAH